MSEFINLRNYSENSFLTGVPTAGEYVKAAKKRGLPAVALTDKNNEHGVIEFYKACQKNGENDYNIKPLIGVNIINEDINENILVFPKNNNGYKKYKLLISLINIKTKNSIFDFEKSDLEDLFFVLSKETTVLQKKENIKEIFDFFGKENVYFEFQPNYDESYFIFLKNNVGIDNIVFSNPTYFIEKDDVETKLIIKAIKDKKTLSEISDDFSNFYFKNKNQLKNSFNFAIDVDEFEKILSNTTKIVDNINIEIRFGENLIPKFNIEGEDLDIYNKYSVLSKYKMTSDEWYFRYLCYSNFEYRYNYKLTIDQVIELVNKDDYKAPEKGLTNTTIDELKELSRYGFSKNKQKIIDSLDQYGKDLIYRIEYELYVIHNMGFDAYFLIVADYINRAKKNGIAVGPGRGSAAGAITAYLSKITDIDPIKYNLLFERFLNPSRISMPDIDTDFADINRQDVIEYCSRKYGRDHVASVCTFGTMAARSSVKDVGRAFGVEAREMNRFASIISAKTGVKLKEEYEENEKFRNVVDGNDLYKQIYNLACKIEGHKRQLGVHACAIIIAPRPLTEFSAIQLPPNQKDLNFTDDENLAKDVVEGTVVTQLEAHDLEDLGLLKMDFLGLKNMSIIQNTLKLIKERKQLDIDLTKIDLNDKKIYEEVFSKGETTGIFQFESNGMRKYLKQLKADKFEELIAMIALYRPGPLEFIPSFIDRKHGREPIKYFNPVLENIMKETYGHCIFQEQIMLMSQVYSGYSMAEADELRKGIGKKNKEIIAKHEERFINGAVANGNSRDEAEYIYKKVIVPAGSYSFNKSHAACYALIAYWTAYLKTYFASEYITACFMSDYDNQERVNLFTREFIRLGGKVLPPDINKSSWNYTLERDGVIRMGLATIKGIGTETAKIIEEERIKNGDFKNLEDFLKRGKLFVNKKVLEGLISAGSLDDFIDQNQAIANMEELIDFSKGKIKKKRNEKNKQKNIFEMLEVLEGNNNNENNKFENLVLPNEYKPVNGYEKSVRQLNVLGVMVSTHPLNGLSKYIKNIEKNRKVIFGKVNNNYFHKEEKEVSIFGYVSDYIISKNSSGREIMTIKILGIDYEIKAYLSPEKTEEYRYDIEDNIGVFIDAKGTFSINQNGRMFNVDKLIVIDPLKYIEKMETNGVYNKDEHLDIKYAYLYNFEEINPYLKLYIALNPIDNKEKLIGYLKDFKEFLQKQETGMYNVILKDINGGLKNTNFYIKDYKPVLSFFKQRKKWAKIFIEDKELKI